ncbi:pectin lyase [Halenospora varia]|nr:pectin lyase [Halenospora varia]
MLKKKQHIGSNPASRHWIDHVKTSLIGLSNSEFDGSTSWFATCDAHHYWAIYFTGSNNPTTFKGSYIHHTSSRGPKLVVNTLLRAVSNYWYAISGHAFDIDADATVLAEGNMLYSVTTPLLENLGKLFSSATRVADCNTCLGMACVANSYGKSGSFVRTELTFFRFFSCKTIASASKASSGRPAASAGVGKV